MSENAFIGEINETAKKRTFEALSRDKVEKTILPPCRSLVKFVKV